MSLRKGFRRNLKAFMLYVRKHCFFYYSTSVMYKKIALLSLLIGLSNHVCGLDAGSYKQFKEGQQSLFRVLASRDVEGLRRTIHSEQNLLATDSEQHSKGRLTMLGLCYLAWLDKKGKQPLLGNDVGNDLADVEEALFAPDVRKVINFATAAAGSSMLIQQIEDAKERFGRWDIRLSGLMRANEQFYTCDFNQIGTGSAINPQTGLPMQTLGKFTLGFTRGGKIELIDEVYALSGFDHLIE